MEQLWIEVSVLNATDEMRLGDSGLMPTGFDENQIGALFRDLRAEHGRCVGKVYRDTRTEEAIPIGWVFQKRDHYADNGRKHYLREAWVTVFTGPRMVRLDRRKGKRHDTGAGKGQRSP